MFVQREDSTIEIEIVRVEKGKNKLIFLQRIQPLGNKKERFYSRIETNIYPLSMKSSCYTKVPQVQENST